jgi:starvation-inducible DNA-binding protein
MNEELNSALTKVMADTFAMYYKAHSSHWNIEGPNFPQYHEFLQDLYTELWNSVDDIAEKIRQLGGYAPSSLSELMSHTMVTENTGTLSAEEYMARLVDANNLVLVANLLHLAQG